MVNHANLTRLGFDLAFAVFFAWVGSIYLTSTGHEFPFAFVIPFVYLSNIIDAWKGALDALHAFPERGPLLRELLGVWI